MALPASRAVDEFCCRPEVSLAPLFRVLLLRRLRTPLPLTASFCHCLARRSSQITSLHAPVPVFYAPPPSWLKLGLPWLKAQVFLWLRLFSGSCGLRCDDLNDAGKESQETRAIKITVK